MAVSVKLVGGFGNCLMQIFCCIAYAIKHNLEYCIPYKVDNPHLDRRPHIFEGLKYCDCETELPVIFYHENGFNYKEIPSMSNCILVGYWQSWKYSYEYKDKIVELLSFDDIETKSGVCSLHFRSTDFNLFPTKHPIITIDYIKDAITHMYFAGYSKFMVFSDAIPEIKAILLSVPMFNNLTFEYSEGNNEITDFKLMASCASNITANSTFSLMAAYINPNPKKIVISPRKWFGADLNHDTKDLYVPNSIIL